MNNISALPSIHVILLAAGRSMRLVGDNNADTTPKPWRMLDGLSVLEHGLMRLAKHPRITSGVIVTSKTFNLAAAVLAASYKWQVALGGNSRGDSVKSGLKALSKQGEAVDYVLIHDAARPFVSKDVLDRLIAALDGGHTAVIPVLAPSDSLKTVADGRVVARIHRDQIYRIQTPQGFDYKMITALHEADKNNTADDDASLVEDNDGIVAVVEGDPILDKITTPSDLAKAEILAKGFSEIQYRMATGYDVHKFSDAPGPIMLGGVAIDHHHGFDAHSDGDVALHALTDAVLGVMADGDIGQHFPPSDAQWKDKDSAFFLAHAAKKLSDFGGSISFADITIIAEMPKITPHRDAIRMRIAEILDIPATCVSVKATTSEGLGFIGRGEGIAVQAAVTARLKG